MHRSGKCGWNFLVFGSFESRLHLRPHPHAVWSQKDLAGRAIGQELSVPDRLAAGCRVKVSANLLGAFGISPDGAPPRSRLPQPIWARADDHLNLQAWRQRTADADRRFGPAA